MDISLRNDDFIKDFTHSQLTSYYKEKNGKSLFLDITQLKDEMAKMELSDYAKEMKIEYLLRDEEGEDEFGIKEQDFKEMIVEKFINYIYTQGEFDPKKAAYDLGSFKKALFFTHRYIPRSF